MPQYTQANRPMAVSTPLGTDVLLLQQVSGTEAISRLFRFQLEFLAESSTDIAFDQILGQSVTVTLQMPDGSSRYINGIVSKFGQGEQVSSPMGSAFFTRYQAEIVPQLWLLTRKAQSRIFQQVAVPDILKQVLTGLSVDYQLQGTYKPRDYCVQYRETDFNFASRLMEEEGIYYFFTHADGSHKMVVADTPMSHPDVPGATTAIYEVIEGGLRKEDRVNSWAKSQEVRSGKYTLWDQCFELPGQNLEAVKPTLDSVQAGTVSHKLKVAGNDCVRALRLPRRLCPAVRRHQSQAAATGPATSRTSSRITLAPSASGCSKRQPPRWWFRARAHAGSSLPGTSSRSTAISTPMAHTS